MDWRSIFYGGPTPRRGAVKPPPAEVAAAAPPPPPDAPPPPFTPEPPITHDVTAGNGGPPLHTHGPDREIRSSKQHRFLFDDGVEGWNRHRTENDFKPVFHGINFVREAARTRLWGSPIDLVGDERLMLTYVDFKFADLQGCVFTRADMRGANLHAADLRKADLTGVLLNDADLSHADLRGAILNGAQLARANLCYANLTGATMKDTNFAWADLSHATVSWKTLQEARLFGATRTTVKQPPPPPGKYY